VSIALRLARFDSELPNPADYAANYFTGIPAPAAGFLVLMPIVIDLEFGLEVVRQASYVSIWLVLIGAGAVSTLPTFAGKKLKLPVDTVLPVLALVGLLGAAIVTEPWLTYLAVATVYIVSLPIAAIRFTREKSAQNSSDT
jgi:CDP-diacylglycerol--serine O-phosphatidyltransferase